MKRIFLLAILGTMAVSAISTTAQAQGPYCGGYGYCGINFPFGLYGRRVEDVPYFSMFPPVYYSMPVPRSYGWSPFAYPPGTMTPEVEPPAPQDMINPYVPQSDESKPAKPIAAHTASYRVRAPQVLLNPFVKSEGIVAAASTRVIGD
jgi:hypothetical protein